MVFEYNDSVSLGMDIPNKSNTALCSRNTVLVSLFFNKINYIEFVKERYNIHDSNIIKDEMNFTFIKN